ncbi:MAG: hypothetical protein RL632_1696 [Bacteroidota bacterium]|jgi:hypothetical protein
MKTTHFSSALLFILFTAFAWTASAKEMELNLTKQDVSCFGRKDGSVTVNISGGVAPYTIVWNTGETSATLTGLSKGAYTVKVTDAKGLIAEAQSQIDMPKPLMLYYEMDEATFVDALSGTMNAKIVGGTPWSADKAPFYFIRLNGNANFTDPTSMTDGVYAMTVEDAKGCKLNVKINADFEIQGEKPQISENPEINASYGTIHFLLNAPQHSQNNNAVPLDLGQL